MIQVFFYILIFFIGIYFGSFFTLAVYRIPKGENITYKHSYCPKCNHKLGLLDLVPVFSYIFLGGKCKYCKNKIRIRYLLLEVLTGLVFVLYAMSLKISILYIDIKLIILLVLGMLYFTGLFIIAGIDKENRTIQKSVLIYTQVIAILYIVYSCTFQHNNVYGYVIYLAILAILQLVDIVFLKRNLKYEYSIQLITLFLTMLIFSKEQGAILTIILTILAIGIRNIILKLRNTKSKISDKKISTQPAFIMCICNIIIIIMANIITNYMIFK